MRKLPMVLFAPVAGVMLMAVPAAAAPGDVMLSAALTGAAETPPTGTDGSGMFMGRLNPNTGQLCYTLTSKKLSAATMAHIHIGAVGVDGPPVVALAPSVPSETCIAVAQEMAAKLIATPGDYYVNVHNTAYPDGAIRGQLAVR